MNIRDRAKQRAQDKKHHEPTPKNAPTETEIRESLLPAPWPEAIPLDEETNEAPPFPLQVLPRVVADFVETVTKSVRCAPDYVAVSCLGVAAASIGSTARLIIKEGFSVQASLFLGIVGESSQRKTPPMNLAAKPLDAEHHRRMANLQERLKREKRQRERDHRGGQETDDEAYSHEEGELILTTCTIPGLADLFRKQPRGTAVIRSELLGWLNGQNQYKSNGQGDDRQSYLEMFDGGTISGRIKKDSVQIRNCCLTIMGGVQPAVMSPFFQSNDGLAARFLWCYPERRTPSPEDFVCVDSLVSAQWAAVVNRLLSMRLVERGPEGKTVLGPTFFDLDEGAKRAWVDFTAWHASEEKGNESGLYREHAGKLDGLGARLSLLMRLLAEATGDGYYPANYVTAIDVQRAAELIKYFSLMAKRVYRVSEVTGKQGRLTRHEGARRILNWAATKGGATFTRSELWQVMRRHFASPEDLTEPLKLLSVHNLVRWLELPYQGAGRRPSPAYEINPSLLGEPEKRAA